MSAALLFERLQMLVKADLEALPDLFPQSAISDDGESIGGVPIFPEETHYHPEASAAFAEADTLLRHDKTTKSSAPDRDSYGPESESESEQTSDAQLERRFVHIPQPEPDPNLERRFVLFKDVKSYWTADESMASSKSRLLGTCLERGALASPDQTFSPIISISKYPYKFVNQRDSQRIASKFFDAGKFWMREWDLYYVWPTDGDKPLVLICEDQLQTLLAEINTEFQDLGLKITAYNRAEGLIIKFPNHPHTTPRYLGRSSSKAELDEMSADAPDSTYRAPGEGHIPPPDDRTLEAFKQMIDDAAELNRAKNKAAKAKKKGERILKQQNMRQQLKRAQRYLGLHPKYDD
ncbi:hypothetical protein AOQ84DRAFT_375871, partial [Glonium stellatum]